MEIITTYTLSNEQFDSINQMWNDEYPISFYDRLSIMLDEVDKCIHYIVEPEPGNIIGWLVVFHKEGETRFSVIVAKEAQGKGTGRLLINKLKSEHSDFYGWVIDHDNDLKHNGERYRSPLPFYQKNGFETLPEQRIDTEIMKGVKVRWTKSNN